MPRPAPAIFDPRKTPLQARSASTVEAVLDATLQVLVAVGKERLTTTRVAHRAGVSVGSLYQYFPNKAALLRACLERHMHAIRDAVEQVCRAARCQPLSVMGTQIVDGFLAAKMRSPAVSSALYAVSSDIDGAALSRATTASAVKRVAELLATAPEGLTRSPEVIAMVVFAALQGVARRAVESSDPAHELALLRDELHILIHAYLQTCAASPASA